MGGGWKPPPPLGSHNLGQGARAGSVVRHSGKPQTPFDFFCLDTWYLPAPMRRLRLNTALPYTDPYSSPYLRKNPLLYGSRERGPLQLVGLDRVYNVEFGAESLVQIM